MSSQTATDQRITTRSPRSLNGIRLLLALGTLCLLYYHLGTLALTESSEARYGSIARTMLDTGDWINPVMNGLPHYSKPPLAYWSSALGMKLCGINEFGARFFLPIAGVLTVLGCFEIGLLLGSLRLALCSSLALVTSLMFLVLFRGLTADPWLAAWETWMIWALLAHDRRPESRYAIGFWFTVSP
ncbi:MAG TPA: glycosyltransferase family 39 protein, partial [Candidatus Ozemobacteraceae bacterium]|nr:glycosyltransferase family 39 protein [Candidatus Ozemobacteraceae bacterium]